MTEDEMVGWHHRLNGHEFEKTLGDGEGTGKLACCSPWGSKESDTTQQLNNNKQPSWHTDVWSPIRKLNGVFIPISLHRHDCLND